MTPYKLKLYRYRSATGDLSEALGSLELDAGNDEAAIRYAGADLSEPLGGSDYAILLDANGRIVKEWGSRRA